MCSCGKEHETTLHYLLRCDLYSIYRLELLNDNSALNGSLKSSSEEKLLKILLYGAEHFTSQMNSEILNCRIKWPSFFPSFLFSFFFFFSDQAFNIFYIYLMLLCSIYVQMSCVALSQMSMYRCPIYV